MGWVLIHASHARQFPYFHTQPRTYTKRKGEGGSRTVIAHTGTSPQSNFPRFAHFQSSDSEGKYWLCGSA